MKIDSILRTNTIKTKVTLAFAIVILGVVFSLTFITGLNRLNNSVSQAKTVAFEQAKNYANLLKREFDEPMNMSVDMVDAILTIRDNTNDPYQRRELILNYLKNVLSDEKFYSSVFTIWESNALDQSDTVFVDLEGHNYSGRFVPNIIEDDKGTVTIEPMEKFDIEGKGDYYLSPKQDFKPMVSDQFVMSLEGRETDVIAFSAPIINDGVFLGVVGFSVPVSKIQEWTEQNLVGNFEATLIGNSGFVIADNTYPEYIGKGLKTIDDSWREIIRAKNEETIYEVYDEESKNLYIFVPFRVANTSKIWGLKYTVSLQSAIKDAYNEILITVVIGILLLIIAVGFVAYSIRRLLRPLIRVAEVAEHVATGKLVFPEVESKSTSLEIIRVLDALRNIVSGISATAQFAQDIGKGNLHANFQPLSSDDILGQSLIEMQVSLKIAQDEREKHRIEGEKRTWATFGLAKFSDILRQHSDNINHLARVIISHLVEYLNANQGGLFVYNDDDLDDIHMFLLASYAYNRQKNMQKKIPLRVGLVGICAVEKRTKYLTEVPVDYINITSGLGDSRPRSLLLVPLVLNDQIFGVLELASFKQFEPNEISFVEQLAENIASTLSSVKVSQQTAELLAQSRTQSEEMKSQEDEMKNGIKELIDEKAKLEDVNKMQEKSIIRLTNSMVQFEISHRKSQSKAAFFEKIFENSPWAVFSINASGEIVAMNDAAFELCKYSSQDVLHKNITLLFHDLDLVGLKDGMVFRSELSSADSQYIQVNCKLAIDRIDESFHFFLFVIDISSQSEMLDRVMGENRNLKVKLDLFDNQLAEMVSEFQLVQTRYEESVYQIEIEGKRQESLLEELKYKDKELERVKSELRKFNSDKDS